MRIKARLDACKPALQRHAPHAEHVGFVALAAAELIGSHAFIIIVSGWLLVTGIVVMWLIDFSRAAGVE